MTRLRTAISATPLTVFIIRQGPDGNVFCGFAARGPAHQMTLQWAHPNEVSMMATASSMRVIAEMLEALKANGYKGPLHVTSLKEVT